jgi:mRNA interferase MazF
MSSLMNLRKGDICMAVLKSNYKYQLQGEHPVIIMSNHMACMHSNSLQIIPITSQDKKPMESHILIRKEFGLDVDSTALCELVTTVDKSILLYKVGQISKDVMLEIDRSTEIQMNINRNYNIEHALKLVDTILELDNLINRHNIRLDERDIYFRNFLFVELKNYTYQHNIDYNRLLCERGISQ